MSFEKVIPYEVTAYETYEASDEEGLRKVASEKIDLPEGFEYDPDFLYLWIRIISSGEYYGPNKNGDYFPTTELESCYHTFNEANVFKNHENKHIEKAIGKIFSVRWNPIMKCVEIFKGIDKKIAPEIARGFLKGYMTDVSMGCKVPYTICSICGNKARRATEFCNHIKSHRMEFLGNGERVFEINYEPKFHDSSVVLNGADRVSKALFIMDEPTATGNTIVRSFKKAAKPVLCENELEKVASYAKTVHPLLQPPTLEKKAYDNPFMQKIAELEKEVTGKILNIVSCPAAHKTEASEQLIQIIKFLTEKRMEEDTLKSIAKNLSAIAESEKITATKVFTTFLSVAEMLGIELFPTELHTLLCELTNAKLENSLQLTESDSEEVYPTDFAKGMKFTNNLLSRLPEFDDPSEMLKTYDEAPFQLDSFAENPASFFETMKMDEDGDLDSPAPMRVVRILKETLSPFQSLRSSHAEHLLPRLSVVLSGRNPIIGRGEVAKDVHLLASPKSAGDVLASLIYGNYLKMRPQIKHSTLVKVASAETALLEKTAKEKMKSKGIKRRSLLLAAVPAVYGASAFQKSRKENGRNLSDAEQFVADRPDLITAGIVIGGKPLSAAVINKTQSIGQGARKITDITKDGFDKLTSDQYIALVKVADSISHGNFNTFSDDMMKKFASTYQLGPELSAAVKFATLLDQGGHAKEAKAISDEFGIHDYEKATFLKFASEYTEEAIEKAAGEFTNVMVLDALATASQPFNTSLPGRVADAFIFKKLTDLTKPKEPKVGELL